MAVQGKLEDMSLPNIVQNICYDQRGASLILRRHIEEGIIFFDGGEIVHAEVGSLEGEEAVYQLLRWTEGTFRISNQTAGSRRTVTAPWNHLLMEGMRLMDEQQARAGASTGQKTKLTTAQRQQDEALEGDLFVLLSRLEQLKDRLSHRKSRKRPPVALRILTELVNEVVTFSEAWLDAEKYADSLLRVLAKAGDIYPSAQMLQVRNNKLSIDVALKLYSSWAKDPVGRRQTFDQIGNCMLDILKTYFSLLITCFHAPPAAESCQELCTVFLADLKQAVDKIQF